MWSSHSKQPITSKCRCSLDNYERNTSRKLSRNVVKQRQKHYCHNFLTASPTPCCAVKQACKVQDQGKSKSCFYLPPCSPSPHTLLPCPFTAAPRGSLSHSITQSCNVLFENILSCEMQRKHGNTNWHLILKTPRRWQPRCRRRGSWGCVVSKELGVKRASWQEVKSSWEEKIRQETLKNIEWLLIWNLTSFTVSWLQVVSYLYSTYNHVSNKWIFLTETSPPDRHR